MKFPNIKIHSIFLALALLGIIIGTGETISGNALAAPTATFTPTATFDAADANPGDGICAIAANLGGACTLRAAIQEANLLAGADTINLSPFVHLLTVDGSDNPPSDPDTQLGDLDIFDPAGLTINGNGATIIYSTATSSFNARPVFHIHTGAQATIDGLVIQNSAMGYQNDGTLTLTNGAIRDGHTDANGNGFSINGIASGGSLTVTNFEISNLPPSSSFFLGSVAMGGQSKNFTLTNVHINDVSGGIGISGSNNTYQITDSSVHNADGFGMHFLSSSNNQITIENSTISQNGQGGIVFNTDNGSTMNILNSTISGNLIKGAIQTPLSNSTIVRLNNVTITNNSASNGFSGGIGIPTFTGGSAQVFVKNSIIAGNSNTLPSQDCGGPIQSEGHNLIGNSTGCTINGDTTGNILNQSPALAALADNGGPTLTHALLAGSPALNAGNPGVPGSGGNTCEAGDQIGANRPLGATCDIGAVEGAQGSAVPPTLTTLSPTSATALGPAFTLTVNGSGFNNSAIVRWKGQNRPTTFINANQLQAAIPATDRLLGEVVNVTVFDAVQGVSSNALQFTVNNPLPTVTTLSPTTVRLGSSVLVTIDGTNFTSNSQVLMDGTPLVTTFVSSTQVKATVPSTATTPIGRQITLRVQNPSPGGGTSAAFLTLTVVIRFPPAVGEGTFSSELHPGDDLSFLTLNWVHPVDWRNLENMELRLLDEEGNVALWLAFEEDLGPTGALVILDEEGRIAGIGFPGDETSLGSSVGTLELADSIINAAPGTTIEATYAIRFDQSVQGRTFTVEMSANNDDGNNGDGHGFEEAGTITIPVQVFLPIVVRQ